jgi:hypothetical protein
MERGTIDDALSHQSRRPIPPLDLKSNNQIMWAIGGHAMDEGEASEGNEREWGGGECEQWITTMRRPIDRVAPLPPSTYESTIS